jgi:uncharacterized membrane protein YtjA (UPF0391 family)
LRRQSATSFRPSGEKGEASGSAWEEAVGLNVRRRMVMLSWTLTFLIIALVAGMLGFGGLAGAATEIAQILFFVFLVLLVVSLVAGRAPRPPV